MEPILESNPDGQKLTFNQDPSFDLSLRRTDFSDDKTRKRFVKTCVTLVRSCPEYKTWTEYVREVLGFYTCSLTGEFHSQTTVEIHHHPFTLHHIIQGLVEREMTENREFCSFDIGSKTISLHYEHRVGFIPLVKSLHEKFHNGFLQLPMELVHGDYRWFAGQYQEFLEEEELETVKQRLQVTRENCGKDQGWKREQVESKCAVQAAWEQQDLFSVM